MCNDAVPTRGRVVNRFWIRVTLNLIKFIAHLPEIANFSNKYFVLNKFYADKGGMKQLYMYHGFSARTGYNPLAKAL